MKADVKIIKFQASKIMKRAKGLNESFYARQLKALFGVRANVACTLWTLLEKKVPHRASTKHLLWTFLFMNNYCIECVLSSLVNADEKTTRK